MQFILFILTFFFQPPLTLKSAAFADKNYMPLKYTCSGNNISPQLTIENIPKNTKSFALIMVDPDTSVGEFAHWVMFNIPVTSTINENSSPGTVGSNGRKERKYTGPCPPNGVHEYHFTIYALDTKLDMPDTTGKVRLMTAIRGHVISSAELVGLFTK